MIRLHFVVEGQTEQGFVNDVLRPHLADRDVFCDTRCVETRRRRGQIYRGGLTSYGKLKNDLTRWTKEDQNPDAYFTTMVDFYGLPGDFPDFSQAIRHSDPFQTVAQLEQAFEEDLMHQRLIPYIQIHEFEALLFCDPAQFEHLFPNSDRGIQNLSGIASQYSSPEHIDRGQQTAPSKRIIAEIPEYADQKAVAGPLIAGSIGLDRMRRECSHFNGWVSKLESLA